jgi:DNA mismatch repair protein MSH5
MNKTRSAGGASTLKAWFYNPLQAIDEITGRHEVVRLVFPIRENLQNELKNVGKISNILTRITISNVPADWRHLLHFVQAYLSILHIAQLNHPFFNRNDSETMNQVSIMLGRIDFDASGHEGRVVIRDGVDTTLDDLKRVYAGLDDFLNQLSDRISLPMPFSLVYFPQLGFLISISDQNTCLPNMEFQFEAEGYAYYKSPEMRDLDMEMGDIHSTITDMELELLQIIRNHILIHSEKLLEIGEWLYNLDCFCSFAESAQVFGYTQPTIVAKGPLQLIGARYSQLINRHPIVELLQEPFVPNDITIQTGVVFTGPNACGKSVLIQTVIEANQIGLITFLAHVGSFVPCQSASIPVVDKILTKIRTPLTISSQESSFCADLRQACIAIAEASDLSLVLFDEFGKGTIPTGTVI